MENNLETTRVALEEKKVALENRMDELSSIQQNLVQTRAETLLADAINVYPEANIVITNRYSSAIYVNAKNEDGGQKEILSIHTRRNFGSNYLNTYATTIDTEFELKRLMFNGKVAQLFLNDPELYNKLFAPTEVSEEYDAADIEHNAVTRALRENNNAIKQAFTDMQINKLKAGQEIEFNEFKTIIYGRGKWECVFRVIKMKAEWVSNKKANVTFVCKYWDDRNDGYETLTRLNVLDKYIISALYHM